MKKNLTHIIAFVFILVSIIGTFGCSNNNKEDDYVIPDYSESNLELPTYGYTPPPYRNDVDYRTEENYRIYHEAGLNILLLQSDDGYDGETWETSHLKQMMDLAQTAGNDKIIVFDERLWRLCGNYDVGLVGVDRQFTTTKDLDDYVANCVKDYSNHSAFYGIQLRDEPSYHLLKGMGDLYKSIMRVLPNAFVQICLLPASDSQKSNYCDNGENMTLAESYKQNLQKFVECSNSNYILFDSYPLKPSGIRSEHFVSLQIANEVCAEKGVNLYTVAQTCSYISNGSKKTRICSQDDMYWQTNLYMGMGVKQIAYFNYWKKKDSSVETFIDGASYITEDGQKTAIYGYMQNIHKEMQNLAKVILNFDYKGCKVVAPTPSDYSTSYLSGLQSKDLDKISNISVKANDAVLVTELYDSDKNNYMYMIQNILDPVLDDEEPEENDLVLDATITFKGLKANKLVVYNKGEATTVDLEKNKYEVKLEAGMAVYVIPY